MDIDDSTLVSARNDPDLFKNDHRARPMLSGIFSHVDARNTNASIPRRYVLLHRIDSNRLVEYW